jgi:hypothetical protein
MRTKISNTANTLKKIHGAFNEPEPSPRLTRAQSIANAYQRGADKIEKLTGKRPKIPLFVNSLTRNKL